MTLILLPKVENEIKKDKYITMKMLIAGQEHFLDNIRSILEKYSLKLQTYKFEKDIPKNEIMYDLNVKYKDEDTLILASNDMTKAIRDIKKLGWE
jgi:putative Mg2+ transporter-C (MgtC) family protein